MHLNLHNILWRWISLFLLIFAPPVWAQVAADVPTIENLPSLVVETAAQAYDAADSQMAYFEQEGLNVTEITLIHIGPVKPKRTLIPFGAKFATSSQKIKVNTVYLPSNDLKALWDNEQYKQLEDQGWKATLQLRHDTGDRTPVEVAQKKYFSRLRTLKMELRRVFDVHNGVTISMYTTGDKRSLTKRLVEGGVAVAKGALLFQVIYHSVLAQNIVEQNHLGASLAAAVGVAWGLFFDYKQQANSAFKGQGQKFDFNSGEVLKGARFHLLWSTIHSVAMRGSMMAAANITAAGFMLSGNDLWHAVTTVSLGLAAKMPWELWYERNKERFGEWGRLGLMTSWGLFYSSLQVLDLFNVQTIDGVHVGGFARNVLYAVSGYVVLSQTFKHWDGITEWAHEVYDRVRGRWSDKASRCNTVLMYRSKSS